MTQKTKQRRNLPPIVLTVLFLPIVVVVAPITISLAGWLDNSAPLVLIPAAILAAYIWVMRRVRLG